MESWQEGRLLQVEFSEVMQWLPAPETFAAGTHLLEQNGQLPWVGVIESGIVRLGMLDTENNEKLLGLRSRGWWLAPEAVILPLPSLLRVTALTEVAMMRIPLSEFARLLREKQLLALHVLHMHLTEKLLAGSGLSISSGLSAQRGLGPRQTDRWFEDEADSALA